MRMISYIKKMIAAGIIMSASNVVNAADDSSAFFAAFASSQQQQGDLLQQIANNTYNTLLAVNNLPILLNVITQMALSWLANDSGDSSQVTQTQANFASLGYFQTVNQTVTNALQQQMTADLLGVSLETITKPANNPDILAALPNVNDLMYATAAGAAPVPHGAGSAYGYAKNAAGMSIPHAIPSDSWEGRKEDKAKYRSYYNTIVAAESFGGYALSQVVSENLMGNQSTTLQNTLVNQAANSSWIAQIATEELGKVLREILLFQSQSYVLLVQLVQTQKQLLTAQVLTNSILIANNQQNEGLLLSKATGSQPR